MRKSRRKYTDDSYMIDIEKMLENINVILGANFLEDECEEELFCPFEISNYVRISIYDGITRVKLPDGWLAIEPYYYRSVPVFFIKSQFVRDTILDLECSIEDEKDIPIYWKAVEADLLSRAIPFHELFFEIERLQDEIETFKSDKIILENRARGIDKSKYLKVIKENNPLRVLRKFKQHAPKTSEEINL